VTRSSSTLPSPRRRSLGAQAADEAEQAQRGLRSGRSCRQGTGVGGKKDAQDPTRRLHHCDRCRMCFARFLIDSDQWSKDTPLYEALGNLRRWGGPNQPTYEDESTLRQLSMAVVHDMAMSTAASPTNEQQTIEAALEQVRSMTKDPEFKSVTIVKYQEGRVVCGLVNSKTTYGGYAGFTVRSRYRRRIAVLIKHRRSSNRRRDQCWHTRRVWCTKIISMLDS
jgi:hypothetical protein